MILFSSMSFSCPSPEMSYPFIACALNTWLYCFPASQILMATPREQPLHSSAYIEQKLFCYQASYLHLLSDY